MLKPDELQTALEHFNGSETFYGYWKRGALTEGAKFLAESAEAYWLMDIVMSYQCEMPARAAKKGTTSNFQSWKLKLGRNGGFTVTCDDGNGVKLAQQKEPYTDFPLKEITLWAVWSDELDRTVIMLPTEY